MSFYPSAGWSGYDPFEGIAESGYVLNPKKTNCKEKQTHFDLFYPLAGL
jgi:hypothetical protein